MVLSKKKVPNLISNKTAKKKTKSDSTFVSAIKDVKKELIKKHNKNKKEKEMNSKKVSELKAIERKLMYKSKSLDNR